MLIRAASQGEHFQGQPVQGQPVDRVEAADPLLARAESMQVGGLKYFRIRFAYGGSTKFLRLTGWSEASALAEFRRHFPEATPEGVEFLGMV